ncbi:interleukin-13 receptor subunit alpha-1-like [Elgaria multicarinata webbii]|uniref:interleukin-13 receptor subunit alpha-1-like n=1 Tax=Elgaria multicarinata webbii TaxID=159646 RepID=UPI002FCD353F
MEHYLFNMSTEPGRRERGPWPSARPQGPPRPTRPLLAAPACAGSVPAEGRGGETLLRASAASPQPGRRERGPWPSARPQGAPRHTGPLLAAPSPLRAEGGEILLSAWAASPHRPRSSRPRNRRRRRGSAASWAPSGGAAVDAWALGGPSRQPFPSAPALRECRVEERSRAGPRGAPSMGTLPPPPLLAVVVALAGAAVAGALIDLPPLSNVSYTFIEKRCQLDVRWNLVEGFNSICNLEYYSEVKTGGEWQKPKWSSSLFRTLQLPLGENTVFRVRTLCLDSHQGEGEWFNISLAQNGTAGTGAINVKCIWHNKQYVVCTWQRGEKADNNTFYNLSYWYSPLKKEQPCTNYTRKGDSFRCTFNLDFEGFVPLSISIRGNSRDIQPVCIVKEGLESDLPVKLHPPTIVNITKTSDGVSLNWTPSKLGATCYQVEINNTESSKTVSYSHTLPQNLYIPIKQKVCVTYVLKCLPTSTYGTALILFTQTGLHVNITKTSDGVSLNWTPSKLGATCYQVEINNTESSKTVYEDHTNISFSLRPNVYHTFRVRSILGVVSSGCTKTLGLWSDWSNIEEWDQKDTDNTLNIILLILIPLSVAILTITLVVYLKRIKLLILPTIPEPGKFLKRMFEEQSEDLPKPFTEDPIKDEQTHVLIFIKPPRNEN